MTNFWMLKNDIKHLPQVLNHDSFNIVFNSVPTGTESNCEGSMQVMTENKQTMFQTFVSYNISELKALLADAVDRDEILFYQRLISLKLGLAQERVVGKELL